MLIVPRLAFDKVGVRFASSGEKVVGKSAGNMDEPVERQQSSTLSKEEGCKKWGSITT